MKRILLLCAILLKFSIPAESGVSQLLFLGVDDSRDPQYGKTLEREMLDKLTAMSYMNVFSPSLKRAYLEKMMWDPFNLTSEQKLRLHQDLEIDYFLQITARPSREAQSRFTFFPLLTQTIFSKEMIVAIYSLDADKEISFFGTLHADTTIMRGYAGVIQFKPKRFSAPERSDINRYLVKKLIDQMDALMEQLIHIPNLPKVSLEEIDPALNVDAEDEATPENQDLN